MIKYFTFLVWLSLLVLGVAEAEAEDTPLTITVGETASAVISESNNEKVVLEGACAGTRVDLNVWINTTEYLASTLGSYGDWMLKPICVGGRWSQELYATDPAFAEYEILQVLLSAEGFLHASVNGGASETLDVAVDTRPPRVLDSKFSFTSGATTYTASGGVISIDVATMDEGLSLELPFDETNIPSTGVVSNGQIRLVGAQTFSYPVTSNVSPVSLTIPRSEMPTSGDYTLSFELMDRYGNTTAFSYGDTISVASDYMTLEITDRDSRLTCRVRRVDGQSPYHTFMDTLCLDSIVDAGATARGDFQFVDQNGGNSKTCSFGRIDYDDTKMSAITTDDCLSAPTLATLPDYDNDGIPNFYDDDISVPSSGSTEACGTGDSDTKRIYRYAYPAGAVLNCTANVMISAAVSTSVGSGAKIAYRAPDVYLGPGFRVLSGGSFSAGVAATTTTMTGRTVSGGAADNANLESPAFSSSKISSRDVPPEPRVLVWSDLPIKLQDLIKGAAAIVEVFHADATGRYIVFDTEASMVRTDDNQRADIYLYDTETDRIELISASTAGGESDGESRNPRIDGEGRLVVFQSTSRNLLPTTQGVGEEEVYVYDLLSRQLTLISRNGASGRARNPVVSSDPPIVAFDEENEGRASIAIYQYQWPDLEIVRYGWDGVHAHHPAIAADGNFVAYLAGGEACELVQGSCWIGFMSLDSGTLAYQSISGGLIEVAGVGMRFIESAKALQLMGYDSDGRERLWTITNPFSQ